MNLKDQALQEFQEFTEKSLPELEQRFRHQNTNLPSLASDIWQAMDKASLLCMTLWSLKLNEEAGRLEDLKIHLSKMHRELTSEMKGLG